MRNGEITQTHAHPRQASHGCRHACTHAHTHTYKMHACIQSPYTNTHIAGGQASPLSTESIIGIAIAGTVALIILMAILAVGIIIYCKIRRKKIYKKYVLPYRSYIYGEQTVIIKL